MSRSQGEPAYESPWAPAHDLDWTFGSTRTSSQTCRNVNWPVVGKARVEPALCRYSSFNNWTKLVFWARGSELSESFRRDVRKASCWRSIADAVRFLQVGWRACRMRGR